MNGINLEGKKVRYQSEIITLASGTPAGLYDRDINIDREYTEIEGAAIYPISDGGIDNYRVGFKDAEKIYHNITSKTDWQPIAVERYKKIGPIENRGQKFTVLVANAQVLASELKFEIVFLLSKPE